MTKKIVDKARRKKADWRGYVNYYPTAEDRTILRDNVMSSGRFCAWVSELAADGYRVSVKDDAYRGTLALEVYGRWDDMENGGKTLVVAHDDVLVSATAIQHYMSEVCDNGVWVTEEEKGGRYSW